MGGFSSSIAQDTNNQNNGKMGGISNFHDFFNSSYQQPNTQFVEQQDPFSNSYKQINLNTRNDLESMPTTGKGAGQGPVLMDNVMMDGNNSFLPQRKIPAAYQDTVGNQNVLGTDGAFTMSATSGQPQMGKPNTFSNTSQVNNNTFGGKGKGV